MENDDKTEAEDLSSMISFTSAVVMNSSLESDSQCQKRLGAKMDVVYNLLRMLGSTEGQSDMSETLLAMSDSVDSCLMMKQSGCIPLLVQLIHAPGQNHEIRERASRALYNIVHARIDTKTGRREARVLRLLEQLREHCQALRNSLNDGQPMSDIEKHPGGVIAALMKLSFDESHRHAMCLLGGLHAVAELIEMDHAAHRSNSNDQDCITLRRYAGMTLTNLTFGDKNNKTLLCSFREFMKALISQLSYPSDDLRQVTASVLRNLSWKADTSSKQTLREIGAVKSLVKAAMEGRKESTLKSILSALWNLSAHCSTNKIDICAVDGALIFLVDMLSYDAPSKTLAIIENSGGILRNVSSYIAVREDYRAIVRDRGCLQVLLKQLRSPSLTVVSNACGTLWNLSARSPKDQQLLWDLGAVPLLRNLVHSKHKMISMGSSAALKNLLSARPGGSDFLQLDSTTRALDLPCLPSLMTRRQKALEQELDQNLSETCENIEPSNSPINKDRFSFKMNYDFFNISGRIDDSMKHSMHNQKNQVQPGPSNRKYSVVHRSESKESLRSLASTQSDTIFEKVNRQIVSMESPSDPSYNQQSTSLYSVVKSNSESNPDKNANLNVTENKYTLRYMNAMSDRLKPAEIMKDLNNLKQNTSSTAWAKPIRDLTLQNKNSLPFSVKKTSLLEKRNPEVSLLDPVSNFECSSDEEESITKSISESKVTPFINNSSLEQCTSQSLDESCSSSNNKFKKILPGNIKVITTKLYENQFDESPESSLWLKCDSKQIGAKSTNSTLCNDRAKLRTPSRPTSFIKVADIDESRTDSDSEETSNIDEVDNNLLLETQANPNATTTNQFNLLNSILTKSPDDDESETTYNNCETENCETISVDNDACDYFTVQETLNNTDNGNKTFDILSPNDDCTMSQTLSYLSVDDKDFHSCIMDNDSRTFMETAPGSPSDDDSKTFSLENDISERDLMRLRLNQCLLSSQVKSDNRNYQNNVEKNRTEIYNMNFFNKDNSGKSKYDNHQYQKQRDPDAMIASLDRLTTTLVQQTEAIRERDSSISMKTSILSDTWNEESPNEVTLSSLSVSAPLIPSLKNDIKSKNRDKFNTLIKESEHLERENRNLVENFTACSNQMSSFDFMEIDAINPPSEMENLISLSASIIENHEKEKTGSQSLPFLNTCRRSLQIGGVPHKAVCQTSEQTCSLENLLNECGYMNNSHLENVKPPSIMNEIIDIGDMENSMLSVESITSEIADVKEITFLNNEKYNLHKILSNSAMISSRNQFTSDTIPSYSDCLDNINPPSLMNEVNQMEETSTINNETLCNDIELCTEDTLNHLKNESINDISNLTDEAVTPLSSEYSSVESTPKKFAKRNLLTPKQKRKLAKDRYKTYIIDAEKKSSANEFANCEQEINAFSLEGTGKITSKSHEKLFINNKSQDNNNEKSVKTSIPMLRKIGSNKTSNSFENKNKLSSNNSKNIQEKFFFDKHDGMITQLENGNFSLNNGNDVATPTDKQKNDIVSPNGSVTFQKLSHIHSHKDPDQAYDLYEIKRGSTSCIDYDGQSNSQTGSDNDDDSLSQKKTESKGPRIIKPINLTMGVPNSRIHEEEKLDSDIPKAIRGKRKPLYSGQSARKSIPQSSPVKETRNLITKSNTSPNVRATRATMLRQNVSQKKVIPKTPSKSKNLIQQNQASKKRVNSQSPVNDRDPMMKPLERQNTFTKDESEIENINDSPSPNKGLKMIPKISPVHVQKNDFVKNSQKNQSPGNSEMSSPRHVSGIPTPKKISNPSRIGKGTNLSDNISPRKESPDQTLASNSIQARKNNIKETTSKISGLWKKVQEQKNKQMPDKNDKKVWITANKSPPQIANADNPPSMGLYRSKTCLPDLENSREAENVALRSVKAGIRDTLYRKSCDFSCIDTNYGSSSTVINSEEHDNVVRRSNRAELQQIDPAKRSSRLNSFIAVERLDAEEKSKTNFARTAPSAIVTPFNYSMTRETVNRDNTQSQNSARISELSLKLIPPSATKVTST